MDVDPEPFMEYVKDSKKIVAQCWQTYLSVVIHTEKDLCLDYIQHFKKGEICFGLTSNTYSRTKQ